MDEVASLDTPPPPPEGRARVARMGDRAVATILDQIALAPILFLAILAIGMKNGEEFENGQMSLHGGEALAAMFLIFLFWMTYYITAEALFAGTLGKHMMGIQVRSSLRNPAKPLQVIIRNLLRVIDVIGLYLLGFLVAVNSKDNQRIGDYAASTMVFESQTDRKFASIMWVLWMVISFGAAIILTMFVAA